MPTIQLPIRNFENQQKIFDDPARYVIAAKGRRFGFTKGAANNTIKWALETKFRKGIWVDTVNANIERYVDRYFIPVLKKLPEGMWKWQKQQKILTIHKSYIDFRSAEEPEKVEGFGYDYAVLNEAGIILKNPYLWDNAIRPMLWDFPCKTFIGGAPKGKGTFEELFNRGLDPNQPNYSSYRFTSFDNPYIQTDVIMEDIKTMPQRVVEQEIYAQFLDDTGVVFRGVKDIAFLQPEEPRPDHMYVIGCDLAKLQDYTVLAAYDRKTNKQVFQMRFNKLEWPFQKSKIKELSMKYNRALVMMDSTGVGEPIHDDLARDGVPIEPIHFTNEQKKQMIEKLANWIELKHLRMLQLEETIQEFNQFTYDISEKTDRVFYGAPVGFHDDIVIAHALAVWSLQPLSVARKEEEMTIIQRDLYEKQKAYKEEQTGEYNIVEYEAI